MIRIKAPTKLGRFYLVDKEGLHCGIGHILHELGVPDSTLYDISTNRDGETKFLALLDQYLAELPVTQLIRENDSHYGTDEERAQHFIKFAKQHGVEFTDDTL